MGGIFISSGFVSLRLYWDNTYCVDVVALQRQVVWIGGLVSQSYGQTIL